ncbi:acyl transferase domain-containing protein [Actinokineospora baliensis]|uniref:beta-ketoacyl synthase N-terminal-like domain-containing protein n=1 Tax=Actinokineospora baliensis TaxID=547056 RepID=UPI00195D0F1E|nr:beta-ketoacyl synthase N-terminal-like domain-containing protein [Actinokineospora baliensis]MBM7774899.1 acyl transferase domain-containing protein [Actinokineospora baliensis]
MSARDPIAVVGMAVMLPGAPDLDTYWHNLRTGHDAITEFPPDRRDPEFHAGVEDPMQPVPPDRTYCHRGGFLAPFTVDAAGLGIMPNAVGTVEPEQLLTLKVAAEAIADAGGLPGLGDPSRIGVILGRGGYAGPRMVGFEQRVRTVRSVLRVLAELSPGLGADELAEVRAALLEPMGPMQPESTINLVPNLTASRVANRLDLRGPAYTIDAACASSLLAVDQAVGELSARRCDTVLTGGVYHGHDDAFWSVFSQLRALSPTQQIRPLSAAADGLLIGEGAGIIALRRLADAHRDGNRVYAVIRGTGSASDGRTQSLFNPDTAGQRAALVRAWSAAGLDPTAPDAVGLVEAHSTGTPVGDAAELTALADVFGNPPGASAVIGSVKSMIGHTMPAAGIAGLIKSVLAIYHGVLLPTLHCAEPNPLLERTRFHTLDTAKPWEGVGPRRAAVNAFGFGGINAHVVVEQDTTAPVRRSPSRTRVAEAERLLWLAADDPRELRRRLDRALVDEPPAHPDGRFRLGVVDPTERRLTIAHRVLDRAAHPGWTWSSGDVWFTGAPLLRDPDAKTAFVFPGLEAEFTPRVDDVATLLGARPPLTDTTSVPAHVAGVADVALLLHRALAAMGVHPDGVAGHSIGEWTAAAATGTVTGDRPAIGLPGFPMPDVDYLALGCSVADATAGIADEPEVVVSHDNAPRQTVVCGPRPAIERSAARFRAAGVIARPLPFQTGFHTPMMRPHLAPYLAAFAASETRPGPVPVWSATTVDRYPDDPAALFALATDFLLRPVRFRELVERMYADGHRVFVHMGPGQLGSFVADTLTGHPHLVINAASSVRPGLAQLRRVATALWTHGANPDLAALTPAKPVTPTRTRVPVRSEVEVRVATPTLRVGESARGLVDRRVAVRELPDGLPAEIAAELSALIGETDDAVRAVAAAMARPPARGVAASEVTSFPGVRTSTMRISVEEMPYLRGHRFFRQRADWPDETDYRPVVPATTLVEWACHAAERAWPGEVAVAVRDARFSRWLIAAPVQEVEIRLERTEAGVSVHIGDCAAMTVELAATYPPAPERAPDPGPAVGPALTPRDVYGARQMFHGPQFQGVTEIVPHAGDRVSGRITVLPAPGFVLDNVGQVLACWLQTRVDRGVLAFPVRIDAITFHGPPAPLGAQVDCLVDARVPDDTALAMDAEIRHGDRVWARITGWQDIRLDCDHTDREVYAFPQDNYLSREQADGWWVAEDRWRTLAAREVFVGVYLNAPERAEYYAVPPREQRTWLLGRIAVKDAVRAWLSERGGDRLFPAEILVTGDGDRPVVRGHHGRPLPELRVALAPGTAAAVSARVERTTGDA